MKKIIITLTVLLAICLNVHGQINLVLNPSFEQYSRCPTSFDQIKFANDWTPIDTNNYSAIGDSFGSPNCTPELCHRCSTSPLTTIPNNANFFHFPKTGNGVAQLVMYYNEEDTSEHYRRDYLQGKLKHNLISGKQYCVIFYVALEEISAYGISHIGAYFDNGSIDTPTNCGMPQTSYTPQVFGVSIISDTLNWTKIQGIFTANGTEKFITIGNFFDNAHTDTLRVHFPLGSISGNTRFSLYLIDDVSVIATDAAANAGRDTLITTATTDSAFVGTNEGYIPCKWYRNGVLIDSNKSGFKVKPTTTSSYVMELDVCGNITKDTVKVTVWPLSIVNGQLLMVNVLFYPNPVANELIVEGARGCEVHIFDVVGREIRSIAFPSPLERARERFDVSGLMKGVYFVKITDPLTGESVTKRLLKE